MRPPAESLLSDEGLCHVEFQGAAPQTSSFRVLLLPSLGGAFHSSSSCAVLASSASLAWCSHSSFSDLEFQNYVTRQIEPNQSKFRYFKVKWWLLLPSLEWVLLLLVFFLGGTFFPLHLLEVVLSPSSLWVVLFGLFLLLDPSPLCLVLPFEKCEKIKSKLFKVKFELR